MINVGTLQKGLLLDKGPFAAQTWCKVISETGRSKEWAGGAGKSGSFSDE